MPLKVLYVEDNLMNAQFLQRGLAKTMPMPVDFHLAQDGGEGVAMAEVVMPDIIIMDLNMPEMDGLTASQKIHTNPHTSHIPIIILTADVVSDAGHRARQMGIHSFLSKPISLRLLRHTIERALGMQV